MVLFFLPSIIYITDKWFVRKKIRNKLNWYTLWLSD
jgi:hypothetical protein